jgi:hypothetical protein
MTTQIDALRISVARLRGIAEPLGESQLTRPAYPSAWSIADVLSHLGSGAAIMQRRLDDVLAGQEPEDYAPAVCDTWNAKSPIAKRDDALVADAALLARIDAVTAGECDRFTLTMGPMTFTLTSSSGSGSTNTRCTPGTSRSPSTLPR